MKLFCTLSRVGVWIITLMLMAWATPSNSFGQDKPQRFRAACDAIDAFIELRMEERGTPGLTLALTTRDSLLYVGTYGYADLKLKRPVTEETLFQIGSITKSFTALALMQLYDAGRFDPDKPVQTYLPWFDVQSEYTPISAHHLLTHSAGIPANRDDMPGSPYQAFALRQQATSWPPGSRFHYSNIGYQVLHQLFEELSDLDYGEAIQTRIFDPLGMDKSRPVITMESRTTQAVGYIPPYDDRPHHLSRGFIEAPHFPYGIGDGSIQSTAADMASYVRMLLNRGRGPHGRIVSESAFERFSTPHIGAGGRHYGYGISVSEREDHSTLAHGGGMVGFGASIVADLTDGLGVASLANGPALHGLIGNYALEVARAVLQDKPIPAPPGRERRRSDRPLTDYAGDYRTVSGKVVHFSIEDSVLILIDGGARVVLERFRDDRFYTPVSGFDRYPFRFERYDDGVVVEVIYGPTWYTNDRYTGPETFDAPEAWQSFVGCYRSYSPWFPYFEVIERKGKLIAITGEGGETSSREIELTEKSEGLFQVGRSPTPEVLRFEDIVAGRALRAFWSGHPFFRTH